MDWLEYFVNIANIVSKKSKDPTTQVGAVIVGPEHQILSTGFNGFPRGIDDKKEERYTREHNEKYFWTEHAERNAIYNAARHGIALRNSSMYCTHQPCIDCARAIIQSGIKHLYIPMNRITKVIAWDWNKTQGIITEGGVNIYWFEIGIQ